ncbi:alpha/beta fold hydrolase [Aquicoccus sp. SCR17]|nr:alpha/beta fold hydrolase [Carideicomes alvinocaridis]
MIAKAVLVVAALLVAGTLLTLWKAGRNERAAEESHPPSGRILEVEGTRVHAWVEGTGPDLVLIHGSSGNLRDFTFDLARRLTDRYRVIAFDRPGLGYTERLSPDGASIGEQAGLLAQAAAQLGAERPIVLGHSYGGAVALAWAVQHPERIAALVTLAAASNPWETGLGTYYSVLSHPVAGRVAIPLITAWVDETRVTQALSEVFEPQPAPEGYAAHFGPGLTLRRGSLRANAMQRASLLDEIEALHPRYGEIEVPVEILHGTADTTVDLGIHSERLARQIPEARLTRLEGVGHMVQHAAPDATVEAIDRAARRAGLR